MIGNALQTARHPQVPKLPVLWHFIFSVLSRDICPALIVKSCQLELGNGHKDHQGAEFAGKVSTSSATNSRAGCVAGRNTTRSTRGHGSGDCATGWSMW